MKLAYHGSTSMKSNIETDILSASKAGLKHWKLKITRLMII